jgi:hypothetical protein
MIIQVVQFLFIYTAASLSAKKDEGTILTVPLRKQEHQ